MTRPLLAAALLVIALAGCRSQSAPDSLVNDSRRQEEQLQNQARALESLTENNTGAFERAMENESRVLFERREAMLNGAMDAANAIELAPDGAPPPPSTARQR